MPPRHGKSRLCSHWLPIWFLRRWPRRRIILAAHTAELAAEFGREVRNTIEEHREALGLFVSEDSAAAHRWSLREGGGMLTAGMGGPITGWGADLFLIDDPIKNAEEAASETIRERNWRWWTSTARTRFEPGATAVITLTRWHEDDIAGRIIAHADPEDLDAWTIVNFPAVAEVEDVLGRRPGDALWPWRFSAEHLRAIEKDVGPYDWAAMYQQRPAPLEGGMFSMEKLRGSIVEDVPAEALGYVVRYWDRAATRKKTAARTAGVKCGFHEGQLFILDVALCQEEPKEVEELMKATAHEDGREVTVWIEQEPGSSGKTVFDHFARAVLPRFEVRSDRPTGDKQTRAKPLSAKVAAGNVKLRKGPWNRKFIEELAMYPNGKFKDQVDAAAGALDKLTAEAEPEIF
jgi:predicted phage terminase large subunit-like protein